MSTFQYGARGEGAFVEIDSDGMRKAVPAKTEPAPAPQPATQPPAQPEERVAPAVADLKPGDVVKLAKQKLQHNKRELKRLRPMVRRLEKESADLERLIAAAKGKPPASVRPINSARRAK